MKVSIGILTHNESKTIVASLESLFAQEIFDCETDFDIELIVIPNGCSDDTAQKATYTLERMSAARLRPCLVWKVCEVAKSGKSRTWNRFVHDFSRRDADFFVLIDGDVKFTHDKVIGSLLDAMQTHPEASVTTSQPLKDISFKKKKSPIERLSVAVSSATKDRYTWISGSLYCARAEVLRKIWMPIGLPAEDGYLWAMVVTDGFTQTSANIARVVLGTNASHIFEAVLDPRVLIRHEVRVIVGMTINTILAAHFRKLQEDGYDAGIFVKEENERDETWLSQLVAEEVAKGRFFIIPLSWLFRRFNGLRYQKGFKSVLLAPAVCMAFVLDVLVYIMANKRLRSGQGVGFW